VRTRKFDQNGTSTAMRRSVRVFCFLRVAIQYANGYAITRHSTVLKKAIQNDRMAIVLTSGCASLVHESKFQSVRLGSPIFDRVANENKNTMSRGSVKKTVR
jgi:hypothetical protein